MPCRVRRAPLDVRLARSKLGIRPGIARGSTAAVRRDLRVVIDWSYLYWMAQADWHGQFREQSWARPSVEDLVVIELLTSVAANETPCEGCGRPLGRDLHLVPGVDTRTWVLIARTRCRGWRRHRHTATVTEVQGDLIMGSFHR